MQCRSGRYTAAVIGNKLHRMWKESERATWFSLPSIGGGAFVCHTPLPSSPAQQIEISETSDGGLSVRRAALLQPPFSVLRPDSGTVVVQRAARSFCSRNHLGFRVIALQRDPPVYSKTVVKGCASRSFNHATLDHVFWPAENTLTPSTSRAREQAYPCSIGAPRIARRLGRRRE